MSIFLAYRQTCHLKSSENHLNKIEIRKDWLQLPNFFFFFILQDFYFHFPTFVFTDTQIQMQSEWQELLIGMLSSAYNRVISLLATNLPTIRLLLLKFRSQDKVSERNRKVCRSRRRSEIITAKESSNKNGHFVLLLLLFFMPIYTSSSISPSLSLCASSQSVYCCCYCHCHHYKYFIIVNWCWLVGWPDIILSFHQV